MWKFYNPVQVIFGAGALQSLSETLKGRKYAVVTYNNAHFHRVANQILDCAPGGVTILDQVSENPDLSDLPTICEAFLPHQQSVEVLVAVGGGSVIDTTKALAVSKGDSTKVKRVLKGSENVVNPLSMIVLPTTTGTGSEVTSWATIWDKENNSKYSLNSPSLFPEVAICDPELTVDLPWSLTVQTGLDALSHAMESIWNNNSNPVSILFATQAIETILSTLPLLKKDPKSRLLRSQIMSGSLNAGLAFSNTKTSIAHNMSYAVTLEKGLAHGIACSFTLPAVLSSFEQSCCQTAQNLRAIFGKDLSLAADELEQWINDLDIATSPSHYGYADSEWRELVLKAFDGERGKNFPGNANQLLNTFS